VPAATLEGWPDWGNAHADNAFCYGGVGERFRRWNRLVGTRTIGYRWFRRCEDNRAPRTLMRDRSTTFGAIAHSHPPSIRRPMPGHRGEGKVPQPTITTAADARLSMAGRDRVR